MPQPVYPVPLQLAHGASVVVGPNYFGPVLRGQRLESVCNRVQRPLPGNGLELPRALGTDPEHGPGESVGMVYPFRIPGNLGADDALGVTVFFCATDLTDSTCIDPLHFEGAGRGTIVRAYAGQVFGNHPILTRVRGWPDPPPIQGGKTRAGNTLFLV